MEWKCNVCKAIVYSPFKPGKHVCNVIKDNIKTTEDCPGNFELQI